MDNRILKLILTAVEVREKSVFDQENPGKKPNGKNPPGILAINTCDRN